MLTLAAPSASRKKGEGVFIGGGTFSSSPMTMIPGLVVLRYLRDHSADIYPKLNSLGERMRRGMEKAFEKAGLPGRSIGIGSLGGIYLPLDPALRLKANDGVPFGSPAKRPQAATKD